MKHGTIQRSLRARRLSKTVFNFICLVSWELIDLAFCCTHCSSLFLCQYGAVICWLQMEPPLASTAGDRCEQSPRPSSFVPLLTNGSARVVTSDTHTHSVSFRFRRYLLILSFSRTPVPPPSLTLFPDTLSPFRPASDSLSFSLAQQS